MFIDGTHRETSTVVKLPRVSFTMLPKSRARIDWPVCYVHEPTARVITAPVGMVTDGMSSPSWTWFVLGHPYAMSVLPAALIHDAMLQDDAEIDPPLPSGERVTRADARGVYYDALRALGRGWVRARWMWAGVALKDAWVAVRGRF